MCFKFCSTIECNLNLFTKINCFLPKWITKIKSFKTIKIHRHYHNLYQVDIRMKLGCYKTIYIVIKRYIYIYIHMYSPNRTSYVLVHELPQSYCGDNQEDTLSSWLDIYYAHLAFVRFEHSVYRGSFMTICIYVYICMYVYMYVCI